MKRPTAYDAICMVLSHLELMKRCTVHSVVHYKVVKDEATARRALDALAEHGLADKTPAQGSLPAWYRSKR